MTISEIINEYGRKASREFPDRNKTVGASEVGLCARRVHWQKHGTPRDEIIKSTTQVADKRGAAQVPGNWGAHVRGSTMEEVLWFPAMRAKFGDSLKLAGADQRTLTLGDLSATPDGVVIGRGGELVKGAKDVVVECKTIDPRVNLVEEKSENALQVQVQMGVIHAVTPYRPTHAVISYIDASFWHDVEEFTVPYNPELFEKMKARAAKIMHADVQDMKPEGWIKGGKECNWCPWAIRCGAMQNAVPAEEKRLNPQAIAEITDLCRQGLTIQNRVKEDEIEFKELQDQIKTRLKDLGTNRLPGVVNWSPVKGRTKWDSPAMIDALKQKGVEVEQFSSTGEPSSQLTIDKKLVLRTI